MDDGDFEDKYMRKLRSDFKKAAINQRNQQEESRRHRMIRMEGSAQMAQMEDENEYNSSDGSIVGYNQDGGQRALV